MSFTINCQACQRPLQVQESYIGKKVRCPACHTVVTVSTPAPPAGPTAGPPPLPETEFTREPISTPSVKSIAKPRATPRTSHEIDFEIFGGELQLVEIELDPGETVIAEAGAMTYMEENIGYVAKMGDGSTPNQGFFSKLVAAGKRVLTGESMFMTHFTNNGRGKRRVAFGAPYPGKIIPLDLSEFDNQIICQKNAFLCGAMGTKIGMKFTKKLGAGFFGGEGFILQLLEGDGLVFMHACGCIIQRDLEEDEVLRMDTGCLVAMTSTVEYDIQKAGNLKTMILGGEGLFLVTLTGPGRVWMQSLPFSRLAERITAGGGTGGGKEEGSILGGIGRMIGGD